MRGTATRALRKARWTEFVTTPTRLESGSTSTLKTLEDFDLSSSESPHDRLSTESALATSAQRSLARSQSAMGTTAATAHSESFLIRCLGALGRLSVLMRSLRVDQMRRGMACALFLGCPLIM